MDRRITALFLVAMAVAIVTGFSAVQADTPVNQGLASSGQATQETGRIIVKFSPAATPNERARVHANFNATVLNEIPALGLQVVSNPNARATEALANAYNRHPLVEFAEPDALIPLADLEKHPNDPNYGQQWHHVNIDSPMAWANHTGGSSLLITICDTGVALHPDLTPNLRTDLGYNTVSKNQDFSPVHWHGTAVAGSAAAAGNNGIGVAGVAWQAGIIPVRVSNFSDGSAYLSDLADCVVYGANKGSTVVNVSYSGGTSSTMLSAGSFADEKGTILVVSAGNSNSDPSGGVDPAHVVYVAATDSANNKASFSSFGNYVDIAAPGVSVLTTYYSSSCHPLRGCTVTHNYAYVSGTSFSAPITAGAVLLIKQANPDVTTAQIRNALMGGACEIGDPRYFGEGLLNVYNSVHNRSCGDDSTPPSPAEAVLESIDVTPANAQIAADATQQFTATGLYDNGDSKDITSSVQWTSSNGAAATINSAGLATGQAGGGVTTIEAKAGGITGSATLTVVAATGRPVITSLTPASAARNQSLTVIITGSGFQPGATVDFGPRVMIQGVIVDSASQIRVSIKVHPQAATGSRVITVTNPDGRSASLSGFTVN